MPYPLGQIDPHVVEAPPTPPRVFLREPLVMHYATPPETPAEATRRRRAERALKLNNEAKP